MTEHLQEISSNGFWKSAATALLLAISLSQHKEQDAVRVALSVMVPRDWLLSKGFRREATLLASNDQRIPVSSMASWMCQTAFRCRSVRMMLCFRLLPQPTSAFPNCKV